MNAVKNVVEVSDINFDNEVLASDLPVLVDFWAPWCAPCRIVAPVVEEIANDLQGKLKVVKLNTDENPVIAQRYGIMSIPTLGIFKNGVMVNSVIGAVPKAHLMQSITPYLDSIN